MSFMLGVFMFLVKSISSLMRGTPRVTFFALTPQLWNLRD
jgi:hypothetical protein